jgi:hypothetical protein
MTYTYHDQQSERLKSTKSPTTMSMSMSGSLPPPTTDGVFEVAVAKPLEPVLIPPPLEQIRKTRKSKVPRRKSLRTSDLIEEDEED